MEHVGYIKSEIVSKATGFHFNLPGHDISHMCVTVLEKVKKCDTMYRKEREHFLIKKFDTFRNGMNKTP